MVKLIASAINKGTCVVIALPLNLQEIANYVATNANWELFKLSLINHRFNWLQNSGSRR